MSLEALVITLTILAIATLWIGAPLLNQKVDNLKRDAKRKQHDRLLVHYERLLNNLRDLEEDFATGKIASEDYEADREALVGRGIQILAALDNHHASASNTSYTHAAAVDESVDKTIEEAVQAYRRKSGSYAK